MNLGRTGAACLFLGTVLAQPVPRKVRYTDLTPAVRQMLATAGVNATDFDRYLDRIDTNTAEREREGENDHLIFYILQSQEFTNAARIEPALSAKQFVESGAIPRDARQRLDQFAKSKINTERFTYFRSLVPRERSSEYLREQYSRAMKSLHAKEFDAKPDYYQTRGHSTDTQITANYALWTALSVLKASQPSLKLQRVLIVGPGLDIAPRTDLVDRYPPQSYQPYATAQALRDLGLAETPRIECVDINDRVLRFINAFPQRSELKLEFGLPRGEPDFEVWARNTASKLASVPRNVARAITAQKLNIVTQRLESRYDLIVATNILVYLNDVEALLAIANIESMLAPAGYFIHNELRAAIDQHTAAVGLKPVQARTVRIGPGRKAPLYDAFAIYEKPAIRK
jgi:hypothetical protein